MALRLTLLLCCNKTTKPTSYCIALSTCFCKDECRTGGTVNLMGMLVKSEWELSVNLKGMPVKTEWEHVRQY